MSEDKHLNDELLEFESQLANVSVADSRVDRDKLMFEAGRAVGLQERGNAAPQQTAGWRWKTTSGFFASLSAVLGLIILLDMGSEPPPRSVAQINQKELASSSGIVEAPINITPEETSADESPRVSIDSWNSRPARWAPESSTFEIRQKIGELDWFHAKPIRTEAISESYDKKFDARTLLNEMLSTPITTTQRNPQPSDLPEGEEL